MERLWSKHKYKCENTNQVNDYIWILTTATGRFLITCNTENDTAIVTVFRVSISFWVNGWQTVVPKHDWMTGEFSKILTDNTDRMVRIPPVDDKAWDKLFSELLLLAVEIIDGD